MAAPSKVTPMDVDVSREAVLWGLVFAVPPALGAGTHVALVEGSSLTLGVAFGTALGLVLFGLVVAVGSTGENAGGDADEGDRGGDADAGRSETP